MVSVIIPTYNRANYIDRAIKSILNQTYKDIEVIVVDDNNPNTEARKLLEEKMKKYEADTRVKYLQHTKNMNGAVARNTGIKIAKGDYITFLDDDDYFLSDRLEIMIKQLEENPEYSCAYSSNIVTSNKKIIGENIAIKSGSLKKELLLGEFSFGSGSNMFFKSEAIKKINGFDETFQRHQDIETMIRFFNNGKILAVREFLLVKTQDDRSNEPNMEKYISVKENYFKAFKKDVESLDIGDQKMFYKNNYMQLVNTSIKTKEKKYYIEFKDKARKYGKITFKDAIRMFTLYINNYIKIENIKYFVKRVKLSIKIDKKIKKEIHYYESI